MDRQDLYEIHQDNLKLLENQLDQVKKMVQINLGKYHYEKNTANIPATLEKLEFDILAGTRLYTFLLCSWLEARLNKILYENSSVAFSDTERDRVMSPTKMSEKWRNCLNMAICKSYGFHFNANQKDYSSCFPTGSPHLEYYQKVYTYLKDIEHAITVRNRLAHGQWKKQLNSKGDSLSSSDINNFFKENDNIQKLDLLHSSYKIIAEIISSYVVYKDKVSTNNFKNALKGKVTRIEAYSQRIKKSVFNDYCQIFYKKECALQAANKNWHEGSNSTPKEL